MAAAKRRALDHYGRLAHQETARAELNASFDRALTTLHMVYQPIVRFSNRSVFAYEALLRTEEPTLRSPDDVFAAAEALGRVIDVGRVARQRVASTVHSLPSSMPVFVNLHPRDLDDEDLLETTSPLSACASRIVLEITERASLDVTADTRERLRALRTIGYRLAIDDLGAGYAGLASLAQFSPDVVKIDMSLTRGVESEPMKQKVIATLTTLCHDLGLLAIVEGVETPDERDALVFLGCDLLQGYLFARPASGFPKVNWGSRRLAEFVYSRASL
jgi:EAL domain-containing protein (putative c-di-GMP-specific phosphodiesterase class I)